MLRRSHSVARWDANLAEARPRRRARQARPEGPSPRTNSRRPTARTSTPELPATGRTPDRTDCSGKPPHHPSRSLRGYGPSAPPMDAMGSRARVQLRSRGRSVVELYNTARPHSQIAWQLPEEFVSTFTPRQSLAQRYANGSAPAPAASPAHKGTTTAGSELRTG